MALLVAASLIFTGAALAVPTDQEQIERGQKPAVLEERTDVMGPMIKQFVRHGVMFMPTFRETEISDAELGSIVA